VPAGTVDVEDKVTNRIREFRKGSNLTQEELAREMKVSRQTIISIEKGKYVPSLQLALRIARFFGCPTDEMFGIREE
jgi:putative transcriptional regulator